MQTVEESENGRRMGSPGMATTLTRAAAFVSGSAGFFGPIFEQATVEDRVAHDFDRARRRARVRSALAWLRGERGARLASFDGALPGWWRQRYGGVRVVETRRIVGSVGRHGEFDAAFMPLKANQEPRWKRIDRAFHRCQDLPPVGLYEVGGCYYVRDGNHRVSVARFHGVEEIEAEVVEARGSPRL